MLLTCWVVGVRVQHEPSLVLNLRRSWQGRGSGWYIQPGPPPFTVQHDVALCLVLHCIGTASNAHYMLEMPRT